MSKHCVKELGEEYKLDYSIDAADKKIGIILNVMALVITLIVFLIGVAIINKGLNFEINLDGSFIVYLLIASVGIFLYLVLHELVHGMFYKIFTKEKIKFGLKWSCAFCGVPNVYVDRITAMCAVIAPFAIFSFIFILAMILIPNHTAKIILLIIFSYHFGGCIGDLYVFLLYLFKYKKDVFMNDTGTKQTFYIK